MKISHPRLVFIRTSVQQLVSIRWFYEQKRRVRLVAHLSIDRFFIVIIELSLLLSSVSDQSIVLLHGSDMCLSIDLFLFSSFLLFSFLRSKLMRKIPQLPFCVHSINCWKYCWSSMIISQALVVFSFLSLFLPTWRCVHWWSWWSWWSWWEEGSERLPFLLFSMFLSFCVFLFFFFFFVSI